MATSTTVAAGLIAGPTPAVAQDGPVQENVALAFESQVDDVTTDELTVFSLATLGDERGWGRAGFTFSTDEASEYKVILAEPNVVDLLCAPIQTEGSLSCQNGPVVALNATRWREAVEGWTDLNSFRQYLVNHEIGHLIGQFHPANRCPVAGEAESLMAPQSRGLEGCQPNAWPLDFEVLAASIRPVALAPAPDVEPDARSINPGGQAPPTTAAAATTAPGDTAVDAEADEPATEPDDLPPATNDAGETVATLGDTPLSSPGGAETLGDADLSSVGEPSANDSNSFLPFAVLAVALGLAVIIALVALVRNRRRHRPVVVPADDLDADDVDVLMAEADVEAPDQTGDGNDLEDVVAATGEVPLAAAIGAGAIGAAALAATSAPSPYPHDDTGVEPADPEPGWSVRLTGGAHREGAAAWLVPRRWAKEESELFQYAIEDLGALATDEPPDPATVGQALGSFLRTHPHLAPEEHEGIGVTLMGTDEVVAAVLGAAEVVELRSGLAKPARRQGVVRLRHHDTSPLEVELSVSASVSQRARIRVERNAPQES